MKLTEKLQAIRLFWDNISPSHDVEYSIYRKKLQQWLETGNEKARQSAKNKLELLRLAEQGDPRPSRNFHSLGNALKNYTTSSCSSFDPEFTYVMDRIAPFWFVAHKKVMKDKAWKSYIELGYSLEKIARDFDASVNAVVFALMQHPSYKSISAQRKRHRLGKPGPNRCASPERLWHEYAELGKSTVELGKKYDRRPASISRILERAYGDRFRNLARTRMGGKGGTKNRKASIQVIKLEHIDGRQIEGQRRDVQERLGMDSSLMSMLLNRTVQTAKGWRIAGRDVHYKKRDYKTGAEHHCSRPILTPAGRFGNIGLAAAHFRIHQTTATYRANHRIDGWRWLDKDGATTS